MHTILIADQQPLFREAMGRAINAAPAILATSAHCQLGIMETDHLDGILNLTHAQCKLDLILINPSIPGMQNLDDLLLQLRNTIPTVPVALIWDGQDLQMALPMIACGAAGIISKTATSYQVGLAISQILNGEHYLPPDILHHHHRSPLPHKNLSIVPACLQQLTDRQLLVLERMTRGESNKQIAWSLGITETTVKTHVSMILRKLKVHNRVQAILMVKDVDFSACTDTHPNHSQSQTEPLHV